MQTFCMRVYCLREAIQVRQNHHLVLQTGPCCGYTRKEGTNRGPWLSTVANGTLVGNKSVVKMQLNEDLLGAQLIVREAFDPVEKFSHCSAEHQTRSSPNSA